MFDCEKRNMQRLNWAALIAALVVMQLAFLIQTTTASADMDQAANIYCNGSVFVSKTSLPITAVQVSENFTGPVAQLRLEREEAYQFRNVTWHFYQSPSGSLNNISISGSDQFAYVNLTSPIDYETSFSDAAWQLDREQGYVFTVLQEVYASGEYKDASGNWHSFTTNHNSIILKVTDVDESGGDKPVGVDDAYIVNGSSLSVPSSTGVLANDTPGGVEGLYASYLRSSSEYLQPTHGVLNMENNGAFYYRMAEDLGYSGIDSFTYKPVIQTASSSLDTYATARLYIQPPQYTITFKPGDHGTLAGADTSGNVAYSGLYYGTLIPAAPAVTAESDYIFTGWTPAYDSSQTVTANATYVAQYTKNMTETTTALTSSSNPSSVGDEVTFTATVSPNSATGTVSFYEGSTLLKEDADLSTTGGVTTATFTTSSLTVGNHTIMAVYSGDGNCNGSTSSSLNQTVNKKGTTTTLTSSSNPSSVGDEVTFTATVSPSSATGTVNFYEGTTSLKEDAAITTASGVATATFTTSSLNVGSHTITAVYSGDSNYNDSTSSSLTQTINEKDTTTTTTALTSSSNPAYIGSEITFTATVNPKSVTGTITFYRGTINSTAIMKVVDLVKLDGVPTATCKMNAPTTVGDYKIIAVYSGDAIYASSTGQITQRVIKTATYTILTSSSNPSTPGDEVTFTAIVSPSTATGTVIFTDGGDPISGFIDLATVEGVPTATFTTSSLTAGSHTITAVYRGDAIYAQSTSNELIQTVATPDMAVTGVAVSPTTATVEEGKTVSLTATVEPSNAANQTVIWSSDKESIATVDANGTVTGVGIGTAIITATTADGGYQDTCTVTVKIKTPTVPAPQVTLSNTVLFNTTDPTYVNMGIMGTFSNLSGSIIIDKGFISIKSSGSNPGTGLTLDTSGATIISAPVTDNQGRVIRAIKTEYGNTFYVRGYVRYNDPDTGAATTVYSDNVVMAVKNM